MYKIAKDPVVMTPKALEEYKKTEEGKKIFDKISPGELLVGGGGTLAGGIIAYLLSKSLVNKATPAQRIIHSLLGAGIGGVGATAAMHTIKDSDTGMTLADKFRSAAIKEPTKELRNIIANNPKEDNSPTTLSTADAAGRLAADIAVGTTGAVYANKLIHKADPAIERFAANRANKAINKLEKRIHKLNLNKLVPTTVIDPGAVEDTINYAARSRTRKAKDFLRSIVGMNPVHPGYTYKLETGTNNVIVNDRLQADITKAKTNFYKGITHHGSRVAGFAAGLGAAELARLLGKKAINFLFY